MTWKEGGAAAPGQVTNCRLKMAGERVDDGAQESVGEEAENEDGAGKKGEGEALSEIATDRAGCAGFRGGVHQNGLEDCEVIVEGNKAPGQSEGDEPQETVIAA